MKGLIGHTGFVGQNLLAQAPFDALYNSANIDSIAGREFELLVCAGARAEKWKANREPERDRAGIESLIDTLGKVRARRFVLVSTVDVYPRPLGVDEDARIDPAAAGAYGRHRRLLEEFAAERFPGAQIVRLPGLFGPGLKKNAVYDLLHENDVHKLHPDSIYQFYDLAHLWADVEKSRDLALLNVATEPVCCREVALRCFGRELTYPATQPARYDLRSRHAGRWGRADGYLYGKEQVLAELTAFVARERAR